MGIEGCVLQRRESMEFAAPKCHSSQSAATYVERPRLHEVLLKDEEKLESLPRIPLLEIDATPVPIDGKLFIRGEKHLFCIAAD